uniref:MS154 n=1 Tax=Microscilla sp. PRE1 TaxID=155537 RepID=Q93P77_9BACT|nr:hypothetical protein [Microscilla sp. PRE1]AAK62876.1 MS154 [Microscilla sp. PRE1]
MTLEQFITGYDFPGSIVLLEGKRDVKQDAEKLFKLGRLLAEQTTHILFRSGNASGADYHFSKRVASIDPTRLQPVAPYKNHHQKEKLTDNFIFLDDTNLEKESAIITESKEHKSTSTLIDKYLDRGKNRVTVKAAFILRDTVKVIGTSEVSSTTFGIFYDDLDKPMTGGTGHTMNTCIRNGIKIIDQSVWMKWL